MCLYGFGRLGVIALDLYHFGVALSRTTQIVVRVNGQKIVPIVDRHLTYLRIGITYYKWWHIYRTHINIGSFSTTISWWRWPSSPVVSIFDALAFQSGWVSQSDSLLIPFIVYFYYTIYIQFNN
ncbi:hypothetical protein ACJX0J_027496 [Zea mays]